MDTSTGTYKMTSPMGGCGWLEDTHDKKGKKIKQSYNWEELNEIEHRRRAILRRAELPFWRILSFWDGTCLKVLSRDFLLWLTLIIYAAIRVQARLGLMPDFVADLGNADISILGGFLSFFLVLFVNQSNIRFNEMYKTSMKCEQSIFDVASVVVTMFPKPDAIRLIRYMNAAHAAGYVGLSATYTKQAFFDEFNKAFKLLTPKEFDRVNKLEMDYGGECFHEVYTWGMKEIQLAQSKEYVDGRLAGLLREKLLSFRAAMDALYDYNDQPVHFYYIHFLSLLSALYLPLFAISNAYSLANDTHWSLEVITALIVIVQAVFVIGLRLLGQQMVDPYGDDLEDLSVLHYVRSGWETSNRILATHFPDDIVAQVEEDLDKSKLSLGNAWESFNEGSSGGVSDVGGASIV